MKNLLSNKNAKRNYFLEKTYEAGIELKGTEVKSISKSDASINEAYISSKDNELFIMNMHVHPFFEGNRENQDPYRKRKLLLHKKEIIKIDFLMQKEGYTLIPVNVYWKNNKIKMTIALAKGKKLHDKREDLKKKTLSKEMKKNIY